MIILGIETSCDETGAAVIKTSDKNKIELLSNVLATSMAQHAKTGGIIPEVASRNQIGYIIPVISQALVNAKIQPNDIDAIAITYGPGLIGSLLVGVETAKTLSYVWKKPLIPVNHLFGHIYANFIEYSPEFPAIALIVSGGHTDIVLIKSHKDVIWLGGTRDDAAGEAFDKIGRLLGLPYPAGPVIEQKAQSGNPKAYNFPRPLMHDKEYDFSFSGLKTAVLREVEKINRGDASEGIPAGAEATNGAEHLRDERAAGPRINEQTINDICRCTQDAIIDVLAYKTMHAAKEFSVKSLLLGGGVAANGALRKRFENEMSKISGIKFFVPSKYLCTDNAAMIAAAAVFQDSTTTWKEISANPELYFD